MSKRLHPCVTTTHERSAAMAGSTHCPICGKPATSIAGRQSAGVHIANCLCAAGHMWEIRWAAEGVGA